jgi:Zn-dependent peptidase ImmA (M78 family)/transcriptional regulator with XRE-family HTH domain
MQDTEIRTALTIAREARGWSQRDLALAAGVSQPALSKAERGIAPLPLHALDAVAVALNVPVDSLNRVALGDAAASAFVHHRRRASTMAQRVVRQVEAVAQITAFALGTLTDGVELAPQHFLPDYSDGTLTPAEAADALRLAWQVPIGPIKHVIGLVESAGVVVIDRDLFTASQDALSARLGGSPRAMILVARGLAPDRLRFTVAHELGHLLLHAAPREGQEAQANAFASELLAPADQIKNELTGLRTGDIERLLDLKAQWGISVAALIRRAFDLDLITDRQYREFQIKLGRLGWRQAEPRQPPREAPTTAERLIALREQSGDTVAAMALRAGMTTTTFAELFLPSRPVNRPTLTLRQDLP